MTRGLDRETLMRYLDGELPPEERRRVEGLLQGSTELQRELALFRGLKHDLADLSFSTGPRNGIWEGVNRRLARPVGWIFLVVGLTLWTGYGVYVFATSPGALLQKLAAGGVVIGILLLLASVIWEQYHAWVRDPYRDVQR